MNKKGESDIVIGIGMVIICLIGFLLGTSTNYYLTTVPLGKMVCLEEGYDEFVSYSSSNNVIKCAYIKKDIKPYDGGWIQEVQGVEDYV